MNKFKLHEIAFNFFGTFKSSIVCLEESRLPIVYQLVIHHRSNNIIFK
jgi:hypothetical protein